MKIKIPYRKVKGKHLYFCLLFFLAFINVYSQGFELLPIYKTTYTISNGHNSIDWGDYDNDGDLDFVLSTNWTSISGIYKNNGGDSFTRITGIAAVSYGSVSWGDCDNDGDLDILLSGSPLSRIYFNDGSDNFSRQIDLQSTEYGECSADWADFDKDGDLDCVVSGYDIDHNSVTNLYWNVNDNFIKADLFLKGGQELAIADYTNDGYPDMLISGTEINGIQHSTLYKNNTNKTFTEQANIPLTVGAYSLAWGDYDNDGNLDILIASRSATNGIKIFHNNGDGSFSDSGLSIENVSYGTAEWGDYNSDGFIDILLTGRVYEGLSHPVSKIYKNNGGNSFSEQEAISIVGVYFSSVSWGDYDADGDLDFLLTGEDQDKYGVVYLYKNNNLEKNDKPGIPQNLKSETKGNTVRLYWDQANDAETPTQSLSYNLRVRSPYILIDTVVSPMSDPVTGYRKVAEIGNAFLNNKYILNNLKVGYYYWSVQTIDNGFLASGFSPEKSFEILPTFSQYYSFERISRSSIAWGDYDNDDDLDILLTGESDWHTDYIPVSFIYAYDTLIDIDILFGDTLKSPTFLKSDNSLSPVKKSSVAWGDYDNDDDLDILMAGDTLNGRLVSKIYRNNGNCTFTDQSNIFLTGVSEGSANWGDYDNDGFLDLLLTGGEYSYNAKIYHNNRDNTFTELGGNYLTSISLSASAWGDYDNDGDLDILITGYTTGGAISKIYRNNGDGTFTDINAGLEGVYNGSVAWGDYDNDADLDIILTGSSTEFLPVTNIYRNDKGIFTNINSTIRKVKNSSVAWGDYDNDGYLDIIISGFSGNNISKVYKNSGIGSFIDINADIEGVNDGASAWGDYDKDGDLDLLFTGYVSGYCISNLYRNNSNFINYPPTVPGNLRHELNGFEMKLNWDKATDPDCPDGSLYYNLKIGTTPDSQNIMSSMSNLVNGYRKIPSIGNVQCNNSWILKNVVPGQTYYWSVQAIDQSFTGSEWAPTDSFLITRVSPDFSFDTVCNGLSTQFTDLSVTTDTIIAWEWDFGDGNTSTQQNPEHLYALADTFSVKLWAYAESGDSASQTHQVIVKPSPKVSFSVLPVCKDEPSILKNNSLIDDIKIKSWVWKFSGGDSSLIQNTIEKIFIRSDTTTLTIVAENGCWDADTQIVIVAQYPVATIYLSPGYSNVFCSGDSSILIVPYNKEYNYQWRLNSINIFGAIDSTLIVKGTSGEYSINVENPVAGCISTDKIQINIYSAPLSPVIYFTGNPESLCQGDSIILSTPDTEGYSYNWKLNGGAVGDNSNQYIAKSSGTYSLTVYNTTGCAADAINTVTVTINSKPILPTVSISGPTTFCQGGSVELSVSNNAAYTYQWENGGDALTGGTTSTFTAQSSGVYSLKITNSNGCYTKTENVTVNVLTIPAAPLITASKALEFCQGDSVELSVTNTLNHTYQWKLNGGATGNNSNKYIAKNSGTYNLTVTNTSNCSVNSTNSVDVSVSPAPTAGNISLNGQNTFCEGGSVTLSVPSVMGYSYNWKNESELITGVTGNSYTATTSGTYELEISNSSGCSVVTAPVDITVKPSPSRPSVSSANYSPGVCPGKDPIILTAGNPVQGYKYMWIKDGEPRDRDTLTYVEFYEKGIYKLRAGLGDCMIESDPVTITLPDAPEKPKVYVKGPVVWYMAAESKTADRYQWYRNGELIAGATKYIYVANKTLGTYKVVVGNKNNCYTMSDEKTIPLSKSETTDFHIPKEYLINEEGDIGGSIQLYPNPTAGVFTIEMENDITGEIEISIITEQGKEIRHIKTEKTTYQFTTEIDLSTEPEGIYIINLKADSWLITRKVIIE